MSAEHDHDAHAGHDDHAGHDHAAHAHLSYPEAVANYRANKDEFFRESDGSPIPAADRPTFLGLPYFAVDESLRFEGLALEPYAGSEPAAFQIPTSDGKLRDAVRAGVFRFELGGTTHALTGYSFAQGASDSIFVPFLDGTSGTESYGAGRYLDMYPEHDGTLRARLQPRLPPVVRVRHEVLVPAHARGEPASGPHRGRRAPGGRVVMVKS